MPGLAGIITRRPHPGAAQVVEAMIGSMRHESAYVTGMVLAADLRVTAAWLAHPDSFAASQAFGNEEKDVLLLLSGECFVPPETKRQLRQQGHDFSETGGDCLVHLYEERGDAFFEELNGLFSGLLIDRRRGKVILFNDRYGLERIYWHETADTFYFASEAKALLRVLPELRAFDREGAAQFLGLGCTIGARTLFQHVQLLPGGSRWCFQHGEIWREHYFTPADWECLPKLSEREYESQFHATFKKILPRYFAADSRLGVSLTGGLDTRLVMACVPHEPRHETTYTFTGPEGETFDDRVAHRVASACGLEHRLLRLEPDFFADFAKHADRTVYVTDGCSGILGAHEIYFHRMARSLAAVRLTGNYGGEIFRGVSTFKPLHLAPQIFNAEFAPMVDTAASYLDALKERADTFAAFHEVPLNLFGSLAAGRSQIQFRSPYLDNELVALAYQRPASLQKSPLPALHLVKASHPRLDGIPTDRGFISDRADLEILARRVFAEVTFKLDYCSNAGLPRPLQVFDRFFKPVVRSLGIAGLHKFLKYSTWFRHALKPFVAERMAALQKAPDGFWDARGLQHAAREHWSGRRDFSNEINAALTLESLERQLFRELPQGVES
ncbi:MAG TPA: asparagine synthase-related protein [Verrucomicrobiae bacterium]